jgi:hypothetical protein
VSSRKRAFCALWALWSVSACADAAPDGVAEAGAAKEQDAAADDADAAAEADASESEPEPVALVHPALWSAVEASEDPFAPAAAVPCLPDSFGEEVLGGELGFYVRTEFCPALTVRQGLRADVAQGETVHVRLFHFPLTAPEAASARLILQLGLDEVLRREIPIPSPQADLRIDWVAPADYARGTPLWFHVENHGANEYVLLAVER